MPDDDNDKRDKIAAILGIIILLLFGVFVGSLLDMALKPVMIRRYVPKQQHTPSAFEKIKSVIMLPFYYVVTYPSMLMNIEDGGIPCQQQSQPVEMQKRAIDPAMFSRFRK